MLLRTLVEGRYSNATNAAVVVPHTSSTDAHVFISNAHSSDIVVLLFIRSYSDQGNYIFSNKFALPICLFVNIQS